MRVNHLVNQIAWRLFLPPSMSITCVCVGEDRGGRRGVSGRGSPSGPQHRYQVLVGFLPLRPALRLLHGALVRPFRRLSRQRGRPEEFFQFGAADPAFERVEDPALLRCGLLADFGVSVKNVRTECSRAYGTRQENGRRFVIWKRKRTNQNFPRPGSSTSAAV